MESYAMLNRKCHSINMSAYLQIKQPGIAKNLVRINIMKEYTVYWKDGRREVVKGWNVADALLNAGYEVRSSRLVAFYFMGANHDYKWDQHTSRWESIKGHGFWPDDSERSGKRSTKECTGHCKTESRT
jgi:hypothetical protein